MSWFRWQRKRQESRTIITDAFKHPGRIDRRFSAIISAVQSVGVTGAELARRWPSCRVMRARPSADALACHVANVFRAG